MCDSTCICSVAQGPSRTWLIARVSIDYKDLVVMVTYSTRGIDKMATIRMPVRGPVNKRVIRDLVFSLNTNDFTLFVKNEISYEEL